MIERFIARLYAPLANAYVGQEAWHNPRILTQMFVAIWCLPLLFLYRIAFPKQKGAAP